MNMKKGIVIGSGITGMSAAVMLAQSGTKVTLIEKHSALAPLLRGFCRDGIHFETGFHFAGGLEKGGLLRAWLKAMELDLPYDNTSPEKEIVCLDGHRFSMPTGRNAILEWTKTYFPSSVSGMETFLDEISEKLNESPYTSPFQEDKKTNFSLKSSDTVSEHLEKLCLDNTLKIIIKSKCLLYGVTPNESLWNDYAFVAGTYFFSSSTIRDGSKIFLQAWEKCLKNKNIRIQYNNAVTQLLVKKENNKFSVYGVILDNGKIFEADYIIYTGSPSSLEYILPHECCKPAYFRHIKNMTETPYPFIIYGISDKSIPELSCWYNIHKNDTFSSLDEKDPTLSIMTGPSYPDGRKSCIAIGIYDAKTGINNNKYKTLSYEHKKKILIHNLKLKSENILPELKKHWKIVDASTASSIQRWVYGSTGSIYGYKHAKNTIPLPPITKIQGFFLAGQNILFPGMLGCIISAAIAADSATGEDLTLNRFRICAKEEL